MNLRERVALLLLFVAGFSLPAYANNPPQPDGLFSILLILPFTMIAVRLAGVTKNASSTAARGGLGAATVILLILVMAGTGLGALAALIVAVFALVRAAGIVRRGQGSKRYVLAAALAAFSLFAFVDYFASITAAPASSSAHAESTAVGQLRKLSNAETQFADSNSSEASPKAKYATLGELAGAQLIDANLASHSTIAGYQYGQLMDLDRKRFFIYALPDPNLKPASKMVDFIPGGSLFHAIFSRTKTTGTRSFAVDETGVIRYAVRTNSQPVTRDLIAVWAPLQ